MELGYLRLIEQNGMKTPEYASESVARLMYVLVELLRWHLGPVSKRIMTQRESAVPRGTLIKPRRYTF